MASLLATTKQSHLQQQQQQQHQTLLLQQQQLCRICINSNNNCNNQMISIFGEDSLWKKISTLADVKIESTDALPHQVCIECAKNTISACLFKKKCEDADNFFRQQLLLQKIDFRKDNADVREQEADQEERSADDVSNQITNGNYRQEEQDDEHLKRDEQNGIEHSHNINESSYQHSNGHHQIEDSDVDAGADEEHGPCNEDGELVSNQNQKPPFDFNSIRLMHEYMQQHLSKFNGMHGQHSTNNTGNASDVDSEGSDTDAANAEDDDDDDDGPLPLIPEIELLTPSEDANGVEGGTVTTGQDEVGLESAGANTNGMIINGTTRGYQCPHCYQIFEMKAVLKAHMQSVHGTAGPVYECTNCKKTYFYKRFLEKHIRRGRCVKKRRNQTRPMQCTDCNVLFPTGHHLGWHKRTGCPSKTAKMPLQQLFKQNIVQYNNFPKRIGLRKPENAIYLHNRKIIMANNKRKGRTRIKLDAKKIALAKQLILREATTTVIANELNISRTFAWRLRKSLVNGVSLHERVIDPPEDDGEEAETMPDDQNYAEERAEDEIDNDNEHRNQHLPEDNINRLTTPEKTNEVEFNHRPFTIFIKAEEPSEDELEEQQEHQQQQQQQQSEIIKPENDVQHNKSQQVPPQQHSVATSVIQRNDLMIIPRQTTTIKAIQEQLMKNSCNSSSKNNIANKITLVQPHRLMDSLTATTAAANIGTLSSGGYTENSHNSESNDDDSETEREQRTGNNDDYSHNHHHHHNNNNNNHNEETDTINGSGDADEEATASSSQRMLMQHKYLQQKLLDTQSGSSSSLSKNGTNISALVNQQHSHPLATAVATAINQLPVNLSIRPIASMQNTETTSSSSSLNTSAEHTGSSGGKKKTRKPNVFIDDEKYAMAKILVAQNASTMEIAKALNVSQMTAWKVRDAIIKGVPLSYRNRRDIRMTMIPPDEMIGSATLNADSSRESNNTRRKIAATETAASSGDVSETEIDRQQQALLVQQQLEQQQKLQQQHLQQQQQIQQLLQRQQQLQQQQLLMEQKRQQQQQLEEEEEQRKQQQLQLQQKHEQQQQQLQQQEQLKLLQQKRLLEQQKQMNPKKRLKAAEREMRDKEITREILELIKEDSNIQYWKVSARLAEKGFAISPSSVCQKLKSMGIHRRWKPGDKPPLIDMEQLKTNPLSAVAVAAAAAATAAAAASTSNSNINNSSSADESYEPQFDMGGAHFLSAFTR